MSRSLRFPLLSLCVFLISVALPLLAQVSPPGSVKGASAMPARQNPAQPLPVVRWQHGVPWRDRIGAAGFAAPPGAHLSYFGGPVISNIHVVQVLYGSGSYDPQVAGAATPSMGNFFSDLTGSNSGYMSLLSQYNTTVPGGTNQTIGKGTFDGLVQITPSSGNDGNTIDDSNIQAELLAQISAGRLPAPVLDAAGNANTIYLIYFPPGKTITQGGSSSCVAGGFCAYHGTTSDTLKGRNILYGVLPDMQPGSGCDQGCGNSTTFGNYTSVTSHELTEAITDADVALATTIAAPLAWYDTKNGEIGDICNAQQGAYVANGTTYTIQLEFSNAANDCVLPPAAPNSNFTLSASSSSVTVTQGSSGSSTITVNPSGGFTGSVTLSASGLPAGVTASFDTNPATSTSSVTLGASATAATGTATVTITGTSGSLTHTTTISLTVNAAVNQDFSLSASPSSLKMTQSKSRNSTITVNPSGGFTGSVRLSASGLPSGVTAGFGANPTTSASVVTLSASSLATTGTVTVTITGTSGSLTHTTTVSLTISAAAAQQRHLLDNPGFENAAFTAPWTLTPAVINNSSAEPPHGGNRDAWLDGAHGTRLID